MADVVDRCVGTYAGRDVIAKLGGTRFFGVPLFELVSCPTIKLADIRTRRFCTRPPSHGFDTLLRVTVYRAGSETPVYEAVC